MIPSFNLVDQPWIPCLEQSGAVVELSLRDVLARSHELVDISADSPMENAALYRFLLAILHRNLGPANSTQWAALWNAEMLPTGLLNAYLDRSYDRFDLFSPAHPFGQFAEDPRVKPRSVVSLQHGFGMLPSGWFDHQVETESDLNVRLTPAQAARDVLTVLAFGFGGLSGIANISHTDAFCAKGVIFIVQGDNLRQTLLLNLNQYQPDPFADEPDRPTWEMDNPLELERSTPLGLLDHLTFPTRSIRLYLDPDKLAEGELVVYQYRLGLGLRTQDVQDPMKHYYESKSTGLSPLSFDEDRQLWRNTYSLFGLKPTGKQPPAIFAWLQTLTEAGVLPYHLLFQCKALGIAKNRGRADFARQEQFPLPLTLLTDEERQAFLKGAIDSVDRTAWVLQRALALTGMDLHLGDPEAYNWATYRIIRKGADKDLKSLKSTEDEIKDWMSYTGVERHFWASLDVPFLRFMERLGQVDKDALPHVKVDWQQTVRSSAETAFSQVLQFTNQTPRAFKAYAYGQACLRPYLLKNFPKEKAS